MAVISFNQSAKGNSDSITIKGTEKELEKIVYYVRHMYDKHVNNDCDDNDVEIDMVNEPPHYQHGMECIDEMILLYGIEETMSFCKLNAHKYRKRAIYKNGEEDQKKSDWYIAKYKELKEAKNKKFASYYIPNNIQLIK